MKEDETLTCAYVNDRIVKLFCLYRTEIWS